MNLISIHYGHNCTVTFSQNGVIKYAQGEERSSGIKNATGFPLKTLDYIKKKFQINETNTEILIIDKTGQGARFLLEYEALEPRSYQSFFLKQNFIQKIKRKIFYFSLNKINSQNKIATLSKINNYKIHYYDHHLCHAATPCLFKGLDLNKKHLIFTMDAEGDNISSGVYSYEKEKVDLISSNNRNKSLGYIYSYTTEILGMKSNEHEFKVMGMAPYGKDDSKKRIAEKLKSKLVSFDKENGEFISLSEFKNFKKTLIKIYKKEKFEDICAGVQFYIEEMIIEWVIYWLVKQKITNVAVSGGVFMNVKATKKISELDIVENLFVTPSCGDESLGFGAIFLKQKEDNIKYNHINNLYLGESFSNQNVFLDYQKSGWDKLLDFEKLEFDQLNKVLAKHLTEKKIIGRFSGKSEWGARALGNRSILCDPRNRENIDILNKKIKSRDYWMPFAPSIIFDDVYLYFKNKKGINSDFMQTSFDATNFAKKNIPAAIHPKDFTLRPQVVREETNKDYYDLINNFKQLTGIGCLLNTSFNLHGNPNVGTPDHAFYTFVNSGLDVLNIENFIFYKKNSKNFL